MLKKIVAILITLAMVLSISLSAFAEDNGQPPESPSGQMEPPDGGNGQPPEMPDGNPPDGAPGGFGGGTPSGGGTADFTYTAVTEITEATEQAEQTYSSETADESALIINTSDEVRITNPTVTKTGDSNVGDNCNFYGLNAGLLVMGGSITTITGGIIETSASGANGVFSYGGNGGRNGAEGDGTTVNISDTIITTTGDGSGGIMTTGGGITNASNLTVTTSGRSSAAIRTDRGGGTVNVDGGSYTSNGLGSPAIYSTADITVSDATLKATNSEAVVIEGGNSVTLKNVDITGSNGQLNGQSTHKTNVLIYQSMSGDASEGSSTFTMNGGTMTCETGSMFHVTNTTTTVNLNGVSFNYSADSSVFLDATADSWGASGSNGGNVTLNLTNQDITGAIVADSASTVAVNLDGNSTWTLGGDSYVTTFTGDLSRVNTNGYTLYVNGEAVA